MNHQRFCQSIRRHGITFDENIDVMYMYMLKLVLFCQKTYLENKRTIKALIHLCSCLCVANIYYPVLLITFLETKKKSCIIERKLKILIPKNPVKLSTVQKAKTK